MRQDSRHSARGKTPLYDSSPEPALLETTVLAVFGIVYRGLLLAGRPGGRANTPATPDSTCLNPSCSRS